MHLTAYSDYSMRVLISLALQRQELTTIKDIARAYGISQHHLMKVVHQLGLAGYIETVRGHGGGIRLKKKPAEITLGEVLRRTEPDLNLVDCFRGPGLCGIQPACALSGVLAEALKAFLIVLDRYTLADLVRKPQALVSLLKLPNAPTAGTSVRPHPARA